MAKRQSDNPGHQRILRRAIDKSAAFQNCGNGEHGAGRDLSSTDVDGAEDVVSGVVNACETHDENEKSD